MNLGSRGYCNLPAGAANRFGDRRSKGVAYLRGLGGKGSVQGRANLRAGRDIASGSRLRVSDGFSALRSLAVYTAGSTGVILVSCAGGRRRGALSAARV